MRKVRKQIYLDEQQNAMLRELTEQTGLSEAEVIRQALDRYAPILRLPPTDREAWQEEEQFIDSLIAQGPVPGGRTWRREDL